MQDYVCDGGIWQTFGERLPGQAAIGRVPDTDVGADVKVCGLGRIDDDRIRLYIEQAVRASGFRSAARLPIRPVEEPYPSIIPVAPEGDIDLVWIGGIYGHRGDDTDRQL